MEKINFKLNEGIILISVVIGNEKGYMALDTGAVQTIINQNYFDIDGEKSSVITFSEELQTSTVKKTEITFLQIGQQIHRNLAVLCLDMNYVEKELKKNDSQIKFFGSIGLDILANQKFLINYKDKQILFRPRIDQESKYTESFYVDKVPIVKVEIENKKIPCVLDTGASIFLLDKKFESLLDSNGKSKLFLFNRSYENINVKISDLTYLINKVGASGIIGYEIFQNKKVLFDFEKNNCCLID